MIMMARTVIGLIVLGWMTFTASAIDNKCLNCICQVESNCRNDVGCHDDVGSLSCGPYQIKEPYWIDCGRPDGSWKNCANNKQCAEKCVRAYMARYAAKCKPNPTCETFARVHNGGPQGCKSSATIGYWQKVKRCMR